ncbi:MAG: hypothetical protein AB4911_06405 [Oscillochloridaceae bacterium umkhey_bin13]
MQQFFVRANEALYQDLSEYANVLRTIAQALPKAKASCEQAVREARLVQALIAFGSGPQIIELSRLTLHLGNLWGVRDDLPARATGFGPQLEESVRARDLAAAGLKLASQREQDALSAELRVCFTNMIEHLHEQERLLKECDELIQPFRTSPELTRKRLALLIAAAEARLPDTPARNSTIATYREADQLLAEWSGGVTLDEAGIGTLERCLEIIRASSETFGILAVVVREEE